MVLVYVDVVIVCWLLVVVDVWCVVVVCWVLVLCAVVHGCCLLVVLLVDVAVCRVFCRCVVLFVVWHM